PIHAQFGTLEIAAHYAPCDELGGDLYDYVHAPDGRTTLVVGDVSGHGVSAAMITGIIKSAFHEENEGPWEPLAVVDRITAGLRPLAYDRFVTLFCARIDPKKGRLEYVNAGHPAPFLWRAGETAIELTPTGAMLSPAFPEHGCEQKEVAFSAGQQLLIYSDGLTEARDNEGFFGEERLAELLLTSGRGSDLLDAIIERVNAFGSGRPADDDRTLLTATLLAD
ncbi:MAG: sigma-B regulation protein RsbU (phosphoserine phosphatase), partial [Planctomycetota bacterium]